MAASDAFFVGVAKENPTSAATTDIDADGQTKSSAFLTVQSFTNFSAATGAITTAWLALQALHPGFETNLVPFGLSAVWLIVSLVTSAQAGAAPKGKRASFWVSGLFLGLINALTLFAAVIGVSSVAAG